ncbi:Photosystem I reaction center subunit III [Arachis hypogaea]|nr:Photosystem I reaction center subunit III [Arachis hypogaea]
MPKSTTTPTPSFSNNSTETTDSKLKTYSAALALLPAPLPDTADISGLTPCKEPKQIGEQRRVDKRVAVTWEGRDTVAATTRVGRQIWGQQQCEQQIHWRWWSESSSSCSRRWSESFGDKGNDREEEEKVRELWEAWATVRFG